MPKVVKKEGKGHMLKGHINLSTVYLYLKNGSYPGGLSDCDKRAVRKRAKSFCLNDDELYFMESKKDSNGVEGEQSVLLRKVLISEQQQRQTVFEAHIDPEGTHYGIEKTTNAVNSRFYWVGISRIVRDIIHNCPICQAARSNVVTTPSSFLSPSTHSLSFKQDTEENMDIQANTSIMSDASIFFKPDMERATYFWEKVELQILGPFTCGRQKLYVAVALDIFSMWPEVKTLVDLTPPTITHFIMNLICRYGVMKSLILRENDEVTFQNVQLSPSLQSQIGVDLSLENFYVSETKEVWDEIEGSVRSFTAGHPGSWSQCLELCMMPHRVSRPQRAEYTPAFLAHGREFNLPEELSHQSASSYVDVHMSESQRKETVAALMKVFHGYTKSPKVSEPKISKTSHAPMEASVSCVRTGDEVVIKTEVELSDVDDGAVLQEDDPDYMTSTPAKRRRRSLKKSEPSVLTSDRITRRSGTSSPGDRKVDDSWESATAAEKVVSVGAAGLGFGMEYLDAYYNAVHVYKKDGKYPDGFTTVQKRVLRKTSHSYFLEDGMLYYLQGAKSKQKLVVKTSKERLSLLKRAHITDSGVHCARNKLMELLNTWNVYWKGLTLDCEAYVNACTQCELGKEKSRQDRELTAKMEGPQMGEDDPDIDLDTQAESQDGLFTHYEDIVLYLKEDKYPQRCQKITKGKIRRQSKNFKLVDNVLYFVSHAENNEQLRQVLVTEEERVAAIREAHSDYHYGKNRTYNMVKRKYFWRRMMDDIVEYLETCGGCDPNSGSSSEDVARRRAHMQNRVSWFQQQLKSQDLNETEKLIEGIMKSEQAELERESEHEENTELKHPSKENDQSTNAKDNSQDLSKQSELDSQTVSNQSEQESQNVLDQSEHREENSKTVCDQSESEEKLAQSVSDQSVTIDQSDVIQQVQAQSNEIPETTVENQVTQSENALVELASLSGNMDHRKSTRSRVEAVTIERPENQDGVISVKVFGDLVAPEDSAMKTIVIDPLAGETHDQSTDKVLVMETQSGVEENVPNGDHDSVDKVILVSSAQDMIESSFISSSADSAVMSDSVRQGVTVMPGATSSGSMEMMIMSADQWNPQDLNILNERVRLQSSEKVCVEQIQDQEQAVILSTVSKAALSSGNALAELVKATVGDLGTDDGQEKESETASAVASIPVTDHVRSEEEMVEDEDKEYVPEEDVVEAQGEGSPRKPTGQGSKPVKKFKCEVCGKTVKGDVSFKVHMYKHTGIKPFCCQVCPKSFTNNKSLRIHMRKHTGDMPFLCNLCGKGFPRSTSLRYHLKAHEEGGGVPVSCDVCGREFTTANRLEKHKNAKHPVQAKVFQCTDCGKVFTAQRSLKRHMVSHQGIRQYQCQVCGRGFFRKEYLTSHLVQHPEITVPPRVPKVRSKKKPVNTVNQPINMPSLDPGLDATAPMQVQSVVQVASSQSDAAQPTDSTTFVFPQESVQYEVECLTSESTLTEADLKAIHFLAQASIHGQF